MVYFFDSSALVKLYHRENGSEPVTEIFNEPGRRILVSRLAGVELFSAVALKARTGHLNALAAQALRLRFMAHVSSGEIEVFSVQPFHYSRPEDLIAQHGDQKSLCTLDAIHLAVALDVQSRLNLDAFVVADVAFAEIASVVGLPARIPV